MKRIILPILLMLSFVGMKADEGMWMIGNLSARTDSILRSLGLELTPEQLYNPDGPCLNKAIVMFGGFCSGVVVSPDGLVFTNHHCGFDAIQNHSTTKHDYLRNGFYAKKQKDELPNEGLYVAFHLRTIDVTERMMGGITDDMDKLTRDVMLDSISSEIESEVYDSVECIFGEITPYYKGSKYYLSVYQRFDDVRLVFAPPQSLGKFGGDTDNWMWPRQTCDFSVFRIYANPQNKPAEYSKDNRPYRTDSYAHVSTQGYQEGSYCMTLGYPGSTDRYLSSYGIANTMRTENDIRYEVRGVKLAILDEAMKQSDAIRIMYASKYASSSNYWKFSLGQNKALTDLDVIGEKQKTERELTEWITENHREKYLGVLDSLKVMYERKFKNMFTLSLLEESFYGGSDILQFTLNCMVSVMRDHDSAKLLQEKISKTYKDIDIDLDRKVFKAMLTNYKKMALDEASLPDFYQKIDSLYGGDSDLFVDYLYATSKLTQPSELAQIDSYDSIYADPMFDVAQDVILSVYQNYGTDEIEEYERLLGDAVREMNREKEYYPDANFTLRMSYGIVEGYSPTQDTSYIPYTLPQSLIDKNEKNPDNYDYELIPEVYKWLKKGDFGKRYIDRNSGEMQLCFLTNNDITGGNSGSGMFDGKGQLIGLAFDGNWEAMSSDLKFDTNLQRCIGVDIRYVLSVIEKYGKAKRLINELTIK